MDLPQGFTSRMMDLLGEEYRSFHNCFGEERRQGLRVNTSKISVEEFRKITPFQLKPVPWTDNGFFYRDEDEVTKHPHYYAGLYYIQEPSAMVPASRLPVGPGERVLDLCAAPGGKATELGARLKGTGILVANDLSATRAKALLKNLERFGIANAFVTGEKPQQLLEKFGSCFDKILVDAPCSGEGMFRKDPSLIRSWQERGPEQYAPVQYEILSAAVRMLRPGGMLLYSTCTFSVEENEEMIQKVLMEYPELEMAGPEWYEGFSHGILPEGLPFSDVVNQNVIRIWPHRMEGEGHFAALLRKKGPSTSCDISGRRPDRKDKGTYRKAVHAGSAHARTVYKGEHSGSPAGMEQAEEFLSCLEFPPLCEGEVSRQGEMVLLTPGGFCAPKLRYLRTGLLLGTVKKERFEPSQALAMALNAKSCPNVLDLPSDHEAVFRYLKGETLAIPEAKSCHPGWVLICCDGYPLGWGKWVNGVIRNKYQPGWRIL